MVEKKNLKYNCILMLFLVLQIIVIIFFGTQKAGFHQDEYYSYFSSNRSLGFYYPDREWVDTDTILNEFVVQKGQGFNYGLVALVQSWDVHPPLFYDFLHTICSLTPGIFSKWQGLIVNITAFVISYFLLYMLSVNLGMKEDMRLVVMTAYGFNPMTISCVLFIRMYMLLTVFIIASALCHMKIISLIKKHYMGLDIYISAPHKEVKFRGQFVKYLTALMAVDLLGFLTQYYYLIFMVMIGFFFSIWFLLLIPVGNAAREFLENVKYRIGMLNRLKYVFLYCAGSAVSLAVAVLIYPASLSHIFRGYRGQEAASAFADISNLPERTGFFLGLVGKYLFSGMWEIIAALVLLAVLALFFFIRIKGEKDTLHIAHIRILAASVFAYFLVVAKTALLLGDTSNRYEMPIYPLGILLACYFVRIGVRAIVGNRNFKLINIPVAVTLVIFLFINGKGLLADGNVLFLYREDEERISFASEMKQEGAKTLVMFNEATPDNIWRLTDELLVYDELFYVSEENTDAITDEAVCEADSLLVYAADHENRDEILQKIIESGQTQGQETSCRIISAKDMWTLYQIER